MAESEMAGSGHVLALDVGGTGIKAGLLSRAGDLTAIRRRETGIERGPAAVIETILGFAADLVRDAASSGSPVSAVGVALPGLVDETTGRGVFSATVGWRDVPFRSLLTGRLDVPVAIGHDVRAGGLAEARLGAGVGASRFVFLPIGTSIGGAIMVDGQAERGAHGMAGEIGHIVVRPGGEACDCGLRGCLAAYASASSIARRYRAASSSPSSSSSGSVVRGGADVLALMAAGDPLAVRIWDEAVAALADALLTCSAVLDPRRVVVGGGLAEAGEALLSPLRKALEERAAFHELPESVTASLGDLAGCLGAGLLAWDLLS